MRFKISVVENNPEETIGNITNVDTAQNLIVFQSEEINSIIIGDGKFRFNTGFSPEPIERNKYIPKEEKVSLLKAQKEAYKRVSKELLGSEKKEIDDTDKYMWSQPQYSKLDITNETSSLVYDTDRLEHLILYWQIVCDAFGLVAYNMECAMYKSSPYFLQEIKDAEIRDSLDELNKVKAISMIGNLAETGDQEALLYLSWSLGDRKDKMLGFSKSTNIATLVKALYNFVDGKTKDRGKKLAVNEFVKSYSEYKADRDIFMMKVIIRIADYHNYIYTNRENMYVTPNGIVLGKTLDECVQKLMKPSNRDIFDEMYSDTMKLLTNDL